MKRSHFSDSQITTILKQAKVGSPVPELWREHGITMRLHLWWTA